MTDLRTSLAQDAPPDGLSAGLQALWWDAKGDWKRAHECAQEDHSAAGSLVHAYLHRKEGDLGNADYWYRRAGRAAPATTLEAEWADLVAEFAAPATKPAR